MVSEIDLHRSIADALPSLSHLGCMMCGKKQNVGNVANKLRNGWPKCCGYTMRLFTEREMKETPDGE